VAASMGEGKERVREELVVGLQRADLLRNRWAWAAVLNWGGSPDK